MAEQKKYRTDRLSITNGTGLPLALHLEPWGQRYPMSQDATFDFFAMGPDIGDHLTVIFEKHGIVVYGWSGSTVEVREGGKKLQGGDHPAP